MSIRLTAVAMLATLLGAPPMSAPQGISVEAIKLAEEGRKALEERHFADALSAFNAAAKLAPRTASMWLGVGVSAYMLGQNTEAERQFQKTLQLDPGMTDASLLLGELQYRSGRLTDAVATYQAALKYAPNDSKLLEKIAQWSAEARTESRFAETRGAHFRVLFDGPVDQMVARRAVELLEDAYLRVGDTLRFYPTQSVEVVLYTTEQFRDITRGPSWVGGLYDGRIRVPVKGALDRVDELERVLTHEYVHALVGGVSGRGLPLWVNEGLAVVFEPDGLEQAQRVLRTVSRRPALQDLHTGFAALPDEQARVAYAVSAVAARALLDAAGPSAVLTLFRDLAAGAAFTTAFHQRIGMRYEEFQSMVSSH